jgi:hypothetical protein
MTEPNLKLNIHLTENNDDQTSLEQYIQSQLVVVSKENTNAWHDAKELLGKKLIARDSELSQLKTQFTISAALNVGIIGGYILYRLLNK